MKITPLGKNVQIKVDEEESRQLENGLYKPDTVEQEAQAKGTVMAVGDEVKKVKPGDRVLYAVYAGEVAKDDQGVEYRFAFEEDLIAIIE